MQIEASASYPWREEDLVIAENWIEYMSYGLEIHTMSEKSAHEKYEFKHLTQNKQTVGTNDAWLWYECKPLIADQMENELWLHPPICMEKQQNNMKQDHQEKKNW